MLPLFAKLKSKFAAEKQSAEAEWTTIIEKVADGSATEIEITKAMKASGRTLDELETDVTREQRIRELKAIAEQLPAAVKASEDAQIAHGDFCLQRHAITAELNDEWTSKTSAMQNAQSIVDQCRAAQVELESMLDEAG